ncbi:hypothetical protein [Microbacterium murale]|uniref:Lipoprotein n=1 Tax=Microbacterium murale TaxID=1081040 RepID=A0ABU0P5Y9_9MICO|nr:hypothetical protein [Microbacterium murale]MDQ0642116.1 hypothetical protein [Microbacterium murale]
MSEFRILRRGATAIAMCTASLLALSACAADQGAYCDAVKASDVAPTLYAPIMFEKNTTPASWAEPRLEVLLDAGPPNDELADEHELWVTYVTAVTEYTEFDHSIFELDTDETEAARDLLFNNYTDVCL